MWWLFFAVVIQDHSTAMLIPKICQFIEPESIIVLDRWHMYNKIWDLMEGYQHHLVNHLLHYMDPTSSRHSTTMEASWRAMKSSTPRQGFHWTKIYSII